jgi:hypothetical protein
MNVPSEVDNALELLSERQGTGLRLLGRYGRGEFGAYRIAEENGQCFALKLSRDYTIAKASATTKLLRQLGYPAPLYLIVGEVDGSRCYAVLEELPGEPLTDLSGQFVDQILALAQKCKQGGVSSASATSNYRRHVGFRREWLRSS